jgi:hypothetical protein
VKLLHTQCSLGPDPGEPGEDRARGPLHIVAGGTAGCFSQGAGPRGQNSNPAKVQGIEFHGGVVSELRPVLFLSSVRTHQSFIFQRWFSKQLPVMDHSFAPMKNNLIVRAAWGEYLSSKKNTDLCFRDHVASMIHLMNE